MANGLLESLRGARRIELFAALTVAALLALMLLNASGGGDHAQKTELEARVERILARVDGAGKISAMITQDANGSVTGAVIVTEGLDDIATYLRLQRAVSALLELDAAHIEILGRSQVFGGGV